MCKASSFCGTSCSGANSSNRAFVTLDGSAGGGRFLLAPVVYEYCLVGQHPRTVPPSSNLHCSRHESR